VKGRIGTPTSIHGTGPQKRVKGYTGIFKAKWPGTCTECDHEYPRGAVIMIDKKSKKPRHAYMNSCVPHRKKLSDKQKVRKGLK
jgi:hypothetical protein